MKYALLIENSILSFVERIKYIFSHGESISMITVLTILIKFIGMDRAYLMSIVIIAMLLDALWGVMSSRRRGKYACSTLLSASAVKLLMYGTLMVMAGLLDKSFSNNFIWFSRTVCAILCTAELWSILAHILIVRPNTPIVSLLKKSLEGEVAKKLNVKSSVIKNILNNKRCKKDKSVFCDECGDCDIK